VQTTVSFKEVVEIPDAQTRAKIHATFRIAYIRDAVLPRALDDATFAALHTTMIFNYIDILQSLQASPAFFSTLFRKLKEVDIHSDEAALLFSFVQVCYTIILYPALIILSTISSTSSRRAKPLLFLLCLRALLYSTGSKWWREVYTRVNESMGETPVWCHPPGCPCNHADVLTVSLVCRKCAI